MGRNCTAIAFPAKTREAVALAGRLQWRRRRCLKGANVGNTERFGELVQPNLRYADAADGPKPSHDASWLGGKTVHVRLHRAASLPADVISLKWRRAGCPAGKFAELQDSTREKRRRGQPQHAGRRTVLQRGDGRALIQVLCLRPNGETP